MMSEESTRPEEAGEQPLTSDVLENPELEAAIRDDKRKKKKTLLRDLAETAAYCALVVVVAVFLKAFVLQPIVIDGSSMNTTLFDKDVVMIEKVMYRFSNPERYDVIVFHPQQDTNTLFVKRIIGLPGEVVYVDAKGYVHIAEDYQNGIYIGDRTLTDDAFGGAGNEHTDTAFGTPGNPVILGEDEYFVLGDNRDQSTDSRFESVGKVSKEQIEGRVFWRMYPFSGFGGLS